MGLSVSEHGIADAESGEVTPLRGRGGRLRAARPRLHRAGAARGPGRDRARRGRRAAGAGHRRRHPRRPPLPHDALRRQEHARGDGRGGARPRLRLPRDHRPLGHPRLRRRRPARRRCASGSRRSRALQRRAPDQALPAARRLRGQHPPRRLARLRRRACSTELDWVVASVHTSFRISKREMTDRVVEAVRNPHVDCLGHPTGRLLLRREPYDIDIEAVVAAAARSRDDDRDQRQPEPPRPQRPPRPSSRPRRACRSSATPTPTGSTTLRFIDYSVATARRAGLTAAQVANTRTWALRSSQADAEL